MGKKTQKTPSWVKDLLDKVQKERTQESRQKVLDTHFANQPKTEKNPDLKQDATTGLWTWKGFGQDMKVLYAKFNALPPLDGAAAEASAGSLEEPASLPWDGRLERA